MEKIKTTQTIKKNKSLENKDNFNLIKKAYDILKKNTKTKKANTKTKGEIRGGGKKPWKQKGTGNARAGSNRSPLWRGGGITFGPKTVKVRNKKVNKKEQEKAFKMLYLYKKRLNLILSDELAVKKGKTKEGLEILKNLKIDGNVLIVLNKFEPKIELTFNNISYATVKRLDNLNIQSLLNFKYILFSKEAFEEFKNKYHV